MYSTLWNNYYLFQLTACERENREQSELIAALKSDKESLETNLYESQQLCAQLDTRKEQLEGENQELLIRKENLQGQAMSKWSYEP